MSRQPEKNRTDGGWGLIGGGALTAVVAFFALYAGLGLALDEDPTNDGSVDLWLNAGYIGSFVAALMLLGGVVLLIRARRQRRGRRADGPSPLALTRPEACAGADD